MKFCLPIGALTLFACVLLADTEPTTKADALIATIRKVGREGAGNPDAAKAWKALVAQGPDALIPILSAMKDDDKTVSNWLRPAFEAIAEKALASKTLSKDSLEKFIAIKKHAGSARRLAYEWLVKLDDTAPERLMPGMLLDPSAELRREAISRVVEMAKKTEDKKAATELYEKAFTGAADPEQADEIAKALEKLGKKVDLQKHFGAVTTYHLITPFDHTKGVGWDTAYPPEKSIDLNATYVGKGGKEAKWIEHTTTQAHGIVDLNKVLGPLKGTVAYAVAFVDSPKTQTVDFRCGSMCGLKVFLNGKQILAREEYHHGMPTDQYIARGTLKEGVNTILLKICQNEQTEKWAQEWKFNLRLSDSVGSAIPFTMSKAPAKELK